MNDQTPKRTRNMNTPIGAGSACDRIMAIRRELPAAIGDAVTEVRKRFSEREAAILARVPEDMRAHVGAMLETLESRQVEPILPSPMASMPPEEPRPRPNIYDAEDGKIPEWALEPKAGAPAQVVEHEPKAAGRRRG
jgi:hypothetical protein